MLSDANLIVKSIERNAPSISTITATPGSQEQGRYVTITAIITDDTGIESVTINITDPDDEYYNKKMIRTTGNKFSCTFKDTDIAGTYYFTIKAIDLSIYSNTARYDSSFVVYEDSTDPTLLYAGVDKYVQLVDERIEFFCVATDNVGIDDVKLTIETPAGGIISKTMGWSNAGKYIYKMDFETIGKYKFSVKVYDKARNMDESDEIIFYITENLDDKDNDGMPDWWEEKYGFDPEDPDDAEEDQDDDGFTNVREYQLNHNPRKDIFLQNAVQRVNDNMGYLAGSIIAFIVIIILYILSKRRIFI
jgi:hypothetical protein